MVIVKGRNSLPPEFQGAQEIIFNTPEGKYTNPIPGARPICNLQGGSPHAEQSCAIQRCGDSAQRAVDGGTRARAGMISRQSWTRAKKAKILINIERYEKQLTGGGAPSGPASGPAPAAVDTAVIKDAAAGRQDSKECQWVSAGRSCVAHCFCAYRPASGCAGPRERRREIRAAGPTYTKPLICSMRSICASPGAFLMKRL